ncbi:MAG TPA: pyrimidine-nucleoside phosphorylase [Anaerolineae bacterium]|nr:pyrimidine-nucleoside phosphorylase [Anaerolineae bacterium]
MRAVDIIRRKRQGEELTRDEIEWIVLDFTRGEIPDYQMAAWMMAVVWRGMSERETLDLTMTMAHSGDMLDLSSIAPVVVDKHSTGGVGDKTTLFVAPLVACLGLPVGKMSGRGLGFSGGTLDKLEAIPGFVANLTREQFLEQVKRHGIAVIGQSADLAPADGKMYALRDVTATVESLPLIASSIMSKKIAAGADAIVLDVKVGSGAFMKTEEEARALAETMVAIGRGVGRQVAAVISDMEQPLGNAVGNALEVAEAIDALRGHGPADFVEHCLVIASEMLLLAGACDNVDAARTMLLQAIDSGQATAKFREWIGAQGGDAGVVDDVGLMAQARLVEDLLSPQSGCVAAINAMQVGLATVALGAGREKKGEAIDHAVGVVLKRKVGDRAKKGEPLLTIHANDERRLDQAKEALLGAYAWSDMPVQAPALILEVIR